MSSVFLRDVGGLAPFDCSDTAGMSARWERWLRAFELFADGKGVKHADQKKALMLHTAGLSVQDIFFTLDEGTGENNYLKAKDALDKYFKPQANVPYERLCFREMSQLPSETVEQFVTRLRQKAQSCEFGDAAAVDEQIRDQVISKCLSHNIRRKLLEKGKILTLQQLREIARVMEDSEKQARKIEGAANEVNRVSVNSNEKGNPRVGGKQSTVRCFCCGNVGHKANDKVCPARGKRCRKCNNPGHFEKVCKTKLKISEGRKGGKDRRVRQVGVGVDETDDSEYAFGVLGGADNPDNGEISVKIGGVQVTMIIDSGASCNVLDRKLWEYLKANKVRCASSKATKKLYSYGNKQPLQVAGTFTVDVLVGNRVLNEVEFVVIESEGHALLGRETAIALGVLKLGPQINSLQLSTDGENRQPNILDKIPVQYIPGPTNIDKDAERVCKTCHGCQLVSQPLKPEPMTRTEFPSAPWQHLAADLLGPLPSGDYIFVVVDYYSRFFEMEFTKSITTEKIVSLMSQMFVTHGLPCSLRTDNGPQFISDHFKGYLEKNGIEHRRTTPLWPQANGEIERQNRTILKRLRISQAEGRDWRSQMDDFLMMYRSTPHSTTGVSPAELLFGRKIRTKLPQLQEFTCDDEVRDRDSERKEKGKMYADCKRNACENDIQKGDKVLLRQERDNKLSTPFKQVPFTVVQKNGNSVLVEADGVQYRRNITHVKRYLEREDLKPKAESSDATGGGNLAANPERQALKVPADTSNRPSEEGNPPECKQADPTLAQSDSTRSLRPSRVRKVPSRYHDYVLGCIRLNPE